MKAVRYSFPVSRIQGDLALHVHMLLDLQMSPVKLAINQTLNHKL